MPIVETVLKFLRKIPPFLQLLYLVRFSLVAVLFLVLFPIVTINSAKLSALFLGLFDLDTPLRMFWATCFAYLLSWSSLITMRITLLYGPTRCGLQKLGVIRKTRK